MLAAAPLLGWFFARQVTRRVARLHEAARRVGAGDLQVRVAPKGKDELAELGRAFDGMVAELGQAAMSTAMNPPIPAAARMPPGASPPGGTPRRRDRITLSTRAKVRMIATQLIA